MAWDHKLTPEERKRGQINGGRRRAELLPPERRKQISDIANAIKLAKESGWDPYTRNPSDIQAIDERLLKLVALEAQAWGAKEYDRVARRIMDQLPYLRLRMWLTANAGKNGGTPLDVTEPSEQERRLEEARARRNRALGLEGDAQEIVIDAETEKPTE